MATSYHVSEKDFALFCLDDVFRRLRVQRVWARCVCVCVSEF